MDLREITKSTKRHPWEVVRVKTLINISEKWLKHRSNLRVLDIGCGDAYIAAELQKSIVYESYDGIDIYLVEPHIEKLSKPESNISLHNTYDDLKKKHYNLIFLLDVIEHVEDDYQFLNDIVDKYGAHEALIMITAPAFNFLFSSHDNFLGHYRRYHLKKLITLTHNARLKLLSSGYMFLSLVPVRLLFLYFEKFVQSQTSQQKGAGYWNHGVIISKIIELFLLFDNRVSLCLNKLGIKPPGLTVWALCKKQQS